MKPLILSACLIVLFVSTRAQVSYYKGEWTKIGSQANFSCLLKFEQVDSNVNAAILWTYIAIDSSDPAAVNYYKNKKGRMGIEYARGKFSISNHDIILQGVSKSDPDLIIGLDKYLLKFSLDKKVIYGESYSNGDKDGLVYFIKNDDPGNKENFELMENRLRRRSEDKAAR